jgi:hypothetical protein
VTGPVQYSPNLGGFFPANGVLPTELAESRPPTVTSRKSTPKPTPKNIVSLARARLREVKSELQKLKALEKERAELERLIAAAEDKKPRTQLRAVTKSAG